MGVDKLSKEGTHLDFGQWHIEEFRDGSKFEYYHIPFIETMDHGGHVPHLWSYFQLSFVYGSQFGLGVPLPVFIDGQQYK